VQDALPTNTIDGFLVRSHRKMLAQHIYSCSFANIIHMFCEKYFLSIRKKTKIYIVISCEIPDDFAHLVQIFA